MQLASIEIELSPLPAMSDDWDLAVARTCQRTYPKAKMLRWAIAQIEGQAAHIEAVVTWGDRGS